MDLQSIYIKYIDLNLLYSKHKKYHKKMMKNGHRDVIALIISHLEDILRQIEQLEEDIPDLCQDIFEDSNIKCNLH